MSLLAADAVALDSGALLWQSQGDFLDQKLHFHVAPAPPKEAQANRADIWLRLLSSSGLGRLVLGLTLQRPFLSDKWYEQLAQLELPARAGSGDRRPGADLKLLGVGRKHRPRS